MVNDKIFFSLVSEGRLISQGRTVNSDLEERKIHGEITSLTEMLDYEELSLILSSICLSGYYIPSQQNSFFFFNLKLKSSRGNAYRGSLLNKNSSRFQNFM